MSILLVGKNDFTYQLWSPEPEMRGLNSDGESNDVEHVIWSCAFHAKKFTSKSLFFAKSHVP